MTMLVAVFAGTAACVGFLVGVVFCLIRLPMLPGWLYARKLPKPAIGQVWVSRNSGSQIRIVGFSTDDYGGRSIEYVRLDAREGARPPMSIDASMWNCKIHAERRVLALSPVDSVEPGARKNQRTAEGDWINTETGRSAMGRKP